MTIFYTDVARRGDQLLVREIVNGEHQKRRIKFNPMVWIPTNDSSAEFKSFDETTYLDKRTFTKMSDAKKFIDMYSGQSFSIYGTKNWRNQFICEEYPSGKYDKRFIRSFIFDIETIDETGNYRGGMKTMARDVPVPIVSISLKNSISGTMHVWGMKPFETRKHKSIDINYHYCEDEDSLLQDFLEYWENNTPDVISGWNIRTFDIPYIVNRISKLFGEDEVKRLSPWRIVDKSNVYDDWGSEHVSFELVGIATLDFIELYKKYRLEPRESFKLDYIAHVELGEKKLDYSESGNLTALYNDDFIRFIDYNIQDVVLVDKLNLKLNYIDLTYELAYYSRQCYTDVMSPVKTWESLIYTYAVKNKMMYEMREPGTKQDFIGAFVYEPKLGLKNWIVSIDAASLYPSIIRQLNISNEMLIEDLPPELKKLRHQLLSLDIDSRIDYLIQKKIDTSACKKYGVSFTPNGQFFKIQKQSVGSVMMENLYNQRKSMKDEMISLKKANDGSPETSRKISVLSSGEYARKILLNSNFGASGNQYYAFFDVRIAEAITTSGQFVNKWLNFRLNTLFNKLCKTENVDFNIAGDTDSIYLDMERIVKLIPGYESKSDEAIVDFLDNFFKTIVQSVIDKAFDEFTEYTNSRELAIFWDREVIASRGFWTAKKRYALKIYDSEGVKVKPPKDIKVMGLEIIKSNTPEFCRKKLKECVRIILTKDNDSLISYIEECRKEFNSMPIDDIAQPGGVGNMSDYYGTGGELFKKGAQAHVRGCIIFNKMLDDYPNLVNRTRISDGDKIKKVYLNLPNPSGINIISYPVGENIPKEFGLDEYIDKNTQFEKTFLAPLRGMLDSIGWKSEASFSIDSLFC